MSVQGQLPPERPEVVTVIAQQWTEDSRVASTINVGLPEDEIMQRYLVRRIFREVEFRVKETDGTLTIGYITGFDEKCIQMSTAPAHEADEPASVLIFWPVARIEETGRRLEDLEHEHRSKIRSYSHALRSQCEGVLNARNGQQNRRRESATYG
jgi:hypothetical protein